MIAARQDSTLLEARLRRLEDRQELADLVARYGPAVDDRDAAALAELYAEDSVFDTVAGVMRGRDQVIEYYLMQLSNFGASFHYMHTQTVEFEDDDCARGLVTAHAEMASESGAFWVALRYHDRYVREDGRWRFALRKVEQLYALPLRELIEEMGSPKLLRWPGTEPTVAPLPPRGVLARDRTGGI
jgi:uncharacterized protein (TIGR02246 family)